MGGRLRIRQAGQALLSALGRFARMRLTRQAPRHRKVLKARWSAGLAGREASAAPTTALVSAAEAIGELAANSLGQAATSDLNGIGNHDTLAQLLARSQTGWMETARQTLGRAGPASSALRRIEAAVETPSVAGQDSELRGLLEHLAREATPLPLSWWLMAHTRLFRAGRIEASWAAKEGAARAALRDPQLRADVHANAELLLAAAVQLGGDTLIEETLGTIEHAAIGKPVAPDRLDRMRLEALIETGRYSEARDLFAPRMTNADAAFAAAVAGRRLAVVGPALNRHENGARIDAADLVVRTNFIDSAEFGRKSGMLGRRTDIAYYNSKLRHLRAADVLRTLEAFPQLRPVFRAGRNPADDLGGAPRERIRFHHVFGSVFFGRGYALRHVLSDLVLFPVAGMTIYGVDFFLGPRTHFGGYLDSSTGQLRSYIAHDVRDTWRFARRLKQQGLLAADQTASAILDREQPEFAALIAERLRRHGGKRSKAALPSADPA